MLRGQVRYYWPYSEPYAKWKVVTCSPCHLACISFVQITTFQIKCYLKGYNTVNPSKAEMLFIFVFPHSILQSAFYLGVLKYLLIIMSDIWHCLVAYQKQVKQKGSGKIDYNNTIRHQLPLRQNLSESESKIHSTGTKTLNYLY